MPTSLRFSILLLAVNVALARAGAEPAIGYALAPASVALPGEIVPLLPGQMTPPLPGQIVQALPGQLVPPLPGQIVPPLPGQIVAPLPGQVVQPLPGQIASTPPIQALTPPSPMLTRAVPTAIPARPLRLLAAAHRP